MVLRIGLVQWKYLPRFEASRLSTLLLSGANISLGNYPALTVDFPALKTVSFNDASIYNREGCDIRGMHFNHRRLSSLRFGDAELENPNKLAQYSSVLYQMVQPCESLKCLSLAFTWGGQGRQWIEPIPTWMLSAVSSLSTNRIDLRLDIEGVPSNDPPFPDLRPWLSMFRDIQTFGFATPDAYFLFSCTSGDIEAFRVTACTILRGFASVPSITRYDLKGAWVDGTSLVELFKAREGGDISVVLSRIYYEGRYRRIPGLCMAD